MKCPVFVRAIAFLALAPMMGLAASYRTLATRHVPYAADATNGDPGTLDLHAHDGLATAGILPTSRQHDALP